MNLVTKNYFYSSIPIKYFNCFLSSRIVVNSVRPLISQCTLNPSDKNIIQKKCRKITTNSFESRKYISFGLNLEYKYKIFNFLKKFSILHNAKQVKTGYTWYLTIDGVNVTKFITTLEMPDTFYSWFKVTELHVWMLLVRLNQDGPESKKIRQSLINAMWDDAIKRSKTLAPMNTHKRDNFKFLLNNFSTILFAYDEGLLTNDKVFCNALWYYFFSENCDDPRKIEALVSYIRCQIARLTEIQTKNIKDENITTKIWNSFTFNC